MKTFCFVVCVFVLVGCNSKPEADLVNSELAWKLYEDGPAALSFSEVTNEVTNLTIVRIDAGSAWLDRKRVFAAAANIKTATDGQAIEQIVKCLRSRMDVSVKHQRSRFDWAVFVSTKQYGDTRVVLKSTDNPQVFACILNPAGSVVYVPSCISLP